VTDQSNRVLLEVCVDTLAGLETAVEGGADRIELCAALDVGGLTPSAGFMRAAGSCGVPIQVLIRPRTGTFCYSPAEIDLIRRDIDTVRACGLAGVVIGASTEDGRLDTDALRTLMNQTSGLDTTLHRAFDLVPDQAEALEAAVSLGFHRILTSGGAVKAADGLERLAGLVEQAAGRISIMPGSGVTVQLVPAFLDRLDIQDIHASCSEPVLADDARAVEFGFAVEGGRQTSLSAVQAMKQALVEYIR
jgi:copper homeostasis protein